MHHISIFLKIVLFLLICSFTISAQQNNKIIVQGRVLNNDTGAPLEDANVFLANTTIGTTTGKDGRFIIKNIPFGAYEIIVRFVGYKTADRNFNAYKPKSFSFTFSLNPEAINLNPINVKGNVPKHWKENLKLFTRLFLGETDNARKTKILNPEVINFIWDKKTDKLSAKSDSIINVENKALGYMLYIVLNTFIYTPDKNIKLSYYPRFQELIPLSPKQKLEWDKNRKRTYLDSKRCFFYDLVHGDLSKDYYSLYEGDIDMLLSGHGTRILPSDIDLTCDNDSTIYSLNFVGGLKIENILMPPSYLNFYYNLVSIDKYGNVITSFYSIETYGYWAKQRIADILPKNYIYDNK